MVNYSHGIIYKLVNNVDDKIYIGSTSSALYRRKAEHRSMAKIKLNRPIYVHLNTVGWDTVEIILIETYDCKNKQELHARERHWIDILKPELNKQIPGRTKKEYDAGYRADNPEKIKINNAKYRRNHPAEILAYRKNNLDKLNQKSTCDCGGKYTCVNISTHKKSKSHKDYVEFMNMTEDQIKQMLKI